MTKKLEDLLNMPDSKEIINDDKKKERVKTAVVEQEETMRSMAEFDKITAALPQVKGLGDKADGELEDQLDTMVAEAELENFKTAVDADGEAEIDADAPAVDVKEPEPVE